MLLSITGSGRFDLARSGRGPLVLYLAESQAHAVGEAMQSFRGRTVGDAHLRRHGHVLALVDVSVGVSLGVFVGVLVGVLVGVTVGVLVGVSVGV